MMYSFGRAVLPVDTHVGRVLARQGPYRELGLELRGLDHKQLQSVLAVLVPPILRHSLHVNLVMLGRDVCRAVKPLCAECPARNFCRDYREREVTRIESEERPRTIDLFTGAGGLSEGFHRAGFEVAAAVDMDEIALRTYRLNHPSDRDDRVLCEDITTLDDNVLKRVAGRRRIDVLIGAPPCQGFSHVGSRSKSTKTGYRVTEDDRNYLYTHMVRLALALRPTLFLMENVQHPVQPVAPYQDRSARTYDPDALPAVTFDEATFDLPPRLADDGAPVDRWPARNVGQDPRARRYLHRFDLLRRSPLLFNHTVRYH